MIDQDWYIIGLIIKVVIYIVLCSKIAGIAEKTGLKGYFWLSMVCTPVAGACLLALEVLSLKKKGE